MKATKQEKVTKTTTIVVELSPEEASILQAILVCGVAWNVGQTGSFADRLRHEFLNAGVSNVAKYEEEIFQFCNQE